MTLADLLPDGMSLEDMLVIMSSLSVLVSVLAVWFAFLHRDVAAQRARLIADQRRASRPSVMGPQRREWHQPSRTFMHPVVQMVKLLRRAQANKVRPETSWGGH